MPLVLVYPWATLVVCNKHKKTSAQPFTTGLLHQESFRVLLCPRTTRRSVHSGLLFEAHTVLVVWSQPFPQCQQSLFCPQVQHMYVHVLAVFQHVQTSSHVLSFQIPHQSWLQSMTHTTAVAPSWLGSVAGSCPAPSRLRVWRTPKLQPQTDVVCQRWGVPTRSRPSVLQVTH